MPVPDFQSITLPVLRLAAQGDLHAREAIEKLADQFGLTTQQREELLPSGNQTRFANRVYWAIVYLQKGGLIARRSRGVYSITDQGRQILAAPTERIDLRFLNQFEGIQEFRRTKSRDDGQIPDSVTASPGTPEERIETALDELNEALRASLLDRILTMSPTGFEKLIVDLMLGMGYGASGSG